MLDNDAETAEVAILNISELSTFAVLVFSPGAVI